MHMIKALFSGHEVLFLGVLFVALGCSAGHEVTSTVTHPVLILEVVDIPSAGRVDFQQGEGFIKRREACEFRDVVFGAEIDNGDSLQLKKGGKITIRFEDGTALVLEAPDGDEWFAFESPGRWEGRPRLQR